MMIRSYNPIEPGAPAVWLLGRIGENVLVPNLARDLRHYPEGDCPIDIFIESDGGFSDAGMAIHSLLRDTRRPKRVTILAAHSMAALVAMAGDVIRIVTSGSIFLHRPHYSGAAIAACAAHEELNAGALKRLAANCEAVEQVYVDIVARRTGSEPGFISTLLARETTFGADAALKFGFADEIVALPGAAA